jgi:hypothetical protein
VGAGLCALARRGSAASNEKVSERTIVAIEKKDMRERKIIHRIRMIWREREWRI